MLQKLIALFKREEQYVVSDLKAFDALIQRVRAKVVNTGDVVLLEIKDADAATLHAARKAINAVAPELKILVHNGNVAAEVLRNAALKKLARKK